MKKVLFLLIIILTGCTKYNDLSELTIIKSIGISYQNEYYLSAQIISEIDENNEPIMKTVTANGETIKDAFNNLKYLINKNISLSHVDLLVLSNKLKDNDYKNIIDYFVKSNDFRNDFYCVFSPNPENTLTKSKYDEIEVFLKTNQRNKKDLTKTFNDLINEFIDNKRITLPNIIYDDEIIYLGTFQYIAKEKL